ncbi:hypothetical protein H0H93_011699 [Arthromyces matolae]|nr:hypothetical protein H0H93_011699 [Arthromyces matolae]
MSGSSSSSITSLKPYTSVSTSRLQALYSDISRQKHSNPASYHSNVEWWQRVLELIVSSGLQEELLQSRLVLSCGPRLLERTRIKGVGKPLALGTVVAPKSIYDPGWLPVRIAAFVVGKPLRWALEQMGIIGEDGFFGDGSSRNQKDSAWWGDYVIVPLVERAADEVLRLQAIKAGGAGDRVYSKLMFKQEFGSVTGQDEMLPDVDTSILLKFLERDRLAIVVDKEVIKFLSNDPSEPREINAVDIGILELKTAVRNLHTQVEGLQSKMEECTQKATAAVRQKHKAVAATHLRLKKELEDLLSKRLGSLSNLESTLLRVEAAAGDIEIMKSYESSTATLRTILSHHSLQKEFIDATMDALAEVNADAKEVDDVVRMGADIAVDIDNVDDGELEEELKALVVESEAENREQEELDKRHLKERLAAIGDVPSEVSGLTSEGAPSKVPLS